MAHTKRNATHNSCAFRNPKTFNERRQTEGFLLDEDILNYDISKINRLKQKRNLPTSWDDVVCSAYYEIFRP
jgi:hypothetical protein